MNVRPSDTDVRQGFPLAEGAAVSQKDSSLQSAATPQASATQTNATQTATQVTDDTDERSKAAAAAADKAAAKDAAQKLDQQFQNSQTGLKIRVLDDSKHTIQVQVVDEKSNKVLRTIPQDEMLKLAASMHEMTGVLLNKPT